MSKWAFTLNLQEIMEIWHNGITYNIADFEL